MKNKGVISFSNYEVKKVMFALNDRFTGQEVNIDFDVSSSVEVDEKNTEMRVNLDVDIFKDAEKNNYPFEMSISLRGYFQNETDEKIEKYTANAIAILYPYVRALVSTYTANANVAPLLLPTINVNKMLQNKKD